MEEEEVKKEESLPITTQIVETVVTRMQTGFFESEPGIKSSTRFIFIVGSLLAFLMSASGFYFGFYLVLNNKVDLVNSLIALSASVIGPVIAYLGTLKLVQNSQERSTTQSRTQGE